MRTATFARKTKETDINLTVNLDGSGKTELATGVGFFDHMLDAFSRFAQIDLALTCKGDLYVDEHHTIEDVGICLGKAIRDALSDRAGIRRVGSVFLLDEGSFFFRQHFSMVFIQLQFPCHSGCSSLIVPRHHAYAVKTGLMQRTDHFRRFFPQWIKDADNGHQYAVNGKI